MAILILMKSNVRSKRACDIAVGVTVFEEADAEDSFDSK